MEDMNLSAHLKSKKVVVDVVGRMKSQDSTIHLYPLWFDIKFKIDESF